MAGAGVCGAEQSPFPQVMVFPSLGLSREAFLIAAEFGTQELHRPAQLRLQVFRPEGGAGGAPSRWGSGDLSVPSRVVAPWLLDWSPALRCTEWGL